MNKVRSLNADVKYEWVLERSGPDPLSRIILISANCTQLQKVRMRVVRREDAVKSGPYITDPVRPFLVDNIFLSLSCEWN